ncbi:hypothetical protein ACFP2T_42760 [Plantactinospora solaniradicis]|uniref:Gram-positive cocci surface proteins LPxTG domain-containing protein n=1 Tax=Plantactinospora solaniradicis TaxID=1723736 RepID=A0ABW1KPU9_9ACTN
MVRKRKSAARQTLILAFAAGALTAAAGTLTLRRRRQDGGLPTDADAGQLDGNPVPSLEGRIDGLPQNPISTPTAQHS